jgi:hypothetical protein
VNKVMRTGEPRGEMAGQAARQQPVARHHEEDAALPIEEGEDHRRQRDHRRAGEIGGCARLAKLAQDECERLGAVGEARIGDGADRGGRDRHVDDHAEHHRSDDADREVAPWVLGFLGRRGDRVEAVKGEEDDGGGSHHTHFRPGTPLLEKPNGMKGSNFAASK